MPKQGDSRRGVPFSGKKKKEQLKAKRQEKRERPLDEFGVPIPVRDQNRSNSKNRHKNQQRAGGRDESQERKTANQANRSRAAFCDPQRFKLIFPVESKEEIEERKNQARQPIVPLSKVELEQDLSTVHQYEDDLDIPKRPPWNYKLSAEQLDKKEQQYFQRYTDKLKKFVHLGLSYVELNLETWRQLWRVLEMSDVVLMIADIRFTAVHFSPALYRHVVEEVGKPLIFVLNKIDMVPPSVVVAWKHYLATCYPRLHIVCFSSFYRSSESEDSSKLKGKNSSKPSAQPVGPQQLLEVCEKIVKDRVDLSSWREKISEDQASTTPDFVGQDDGETEVEAVGREPLDSSYHTHQPFNKGVLTIGFCGYPNVGKSSVINALKGKKVVSVSRTPGHTKHFQTIYITPTVKLCDCPGLVFPSVLPKPLQVLCGLYPIAQLREPYTSVSYLAQRVDLVTVLKLSHPALDEVKPKVELKHPAEDKIAHKVDLTQLAEDEIEERQKVEWSAMDICEAWALKRGFVTAKASRPDWYRAANHILRMCLEGRISTCVYPPKYWQEEELWNAHQETAEIAAQTRTVPVDEIGDSGEENSESGESYGCLDTEEHSDTHGTQEDSEESGGENYLASRNPFDLLSEDC